MNKTISINLGGFFFHIDEDAFSKLTRYLDAVKRSLSPEGREEIIKDIESRIAELFQEKIKNEKQVIGSKEVDDMIVIMGQPEDYKIDDEPKNSFNNSTYNYSNNGGTKKLYRDRDNSIIGGVLSGISQYIGIDPIWLRILMAILLVFFGTGFFIYIILWIIIPEARTTTQKLEMRGMPINITNIEKKVKEGIDDISSKISDIDTEKVMYNVKNSSQRVGSTIEDIFTTILKIIGKLLGGFIVLVTSVSLIGLLIGTIFMFFSSTLDHVHMPWNEYLRASNYTDFPMWILYIFSFFAVAIPVFFFFILGLKLLVSNLKSIGSYAKYSLLGLWILSIVFLVYFGLRQASEVSRESKVVEKREVILTPNDTLKINMKFNDFYTKSVYKRSDFKFIVDENDKEIIYSNNVKIHLMKTDESKTYIQIEKVANGSSFNDAKERARNIVYNFDIQGNIINLDNYLITARDNKFRDQEVHIYIYIPKGLVIYPNETISDYLTNHNSDIDIYYGEENHYYKLIDGDFECLDCPEEIENNEWNSDEDNNVEIKINGQDIINSETEIKTINVDENGISIQTKNKK
ncbi:PspC domain-containing protein [uncultured Flavobacterium sp.]|uniref:PspC domain-containing protein n=1 Tax=uncultured Flavobacterium sp. TaxID=165435 RepID=UPI0030C836EB